MKFEPTLQLPHLSVASQEELLEVLGRTAINAGLAPEGYITALKERELEFPTGLPISGGLAIPHTAAEHVTGNTVIVATLNNPVVFGELGGDEDATVEVNTVLLLVLGDANSHVSTLSQLIKKLQDAEFVASLNQASTGDEIVSILSTIFPTNS